MCLRKKLKLTTQRPNLTSSIHDTIELKLLNNSDWDQAIYVKTKPDTSLKTIYVFCVN